MSARGKTSGGVIALYRKFRADVNGWHDVPFQTFRDNILPLRKKIKWNATEAATVRELSVAGCGFALKNLLGDSAELKAVFKAQKMGDGPSAPEEMSKDELDSHMKALIKSCKTDGWPAARFASFLAYLDSSMTIQDLAESSDAKSSSLFTEAKGASTGDNAGSSPSIVPDNDLFAMKYRTGSEVFRNAVRAHLKDAAASAPN